MGTLISLQAPDGHALRAYEAGDPGERRALILCHDHAGLSRPLRTEADALAGFGFRVVAPIVMDRAAPGMELGQTTRARAHGLALLSGVQPSAALLDVAAAALHLGAARIGIVGFDWGATLAWHAAARLPQLAAAVCYYGTGITALRQLAPLCPLQLHVGEADGEMPFAALDAIRRAHPATTIELYPEASHGFSCETGENFHPAAARAARDNMLAFLMRHMEAAPRADAPASVASEPAPPAETQDTPKPADADGLERKFGGRFGNGSGAQGTFGKRLCA